MSLVEFVVLGIAGVANLAVLAERFFKAPQKVIDLTSAIVEGVTIIAVAILSFYGYQALSAVVAPEILPVISEVIEPLI
jgi:hypothetical protein